MQFSKWGASGGRSSSVGRRKDHYLRGRTTKIGSHSVAHTAINSCLSLHKGQRVEKIEKMKKIESGEG